MKTNEILSALNLQRNKQTSLFCSSLSNIFSFLVSNKREIKYAEIVETDLNINNNGKLFTLKEVTKDYCNTLLDHYEYQDKELQELKKELYILSDQHRDKLFLKNKEQRKGKNIEGLENEAKELLLKFNDKNDTIQNLLKIESKKISDSTFTIEEMRKELNLFEGVRLYVCINQNNGIYSFAVPIKNKFYSEVCNLLNIDFKEAANEKKEALKTITIDVEVLTSIKKAAKFVSNDELRPVMQSICLHFENNTCEVVGTDAHKLYMSELLECNSGNETFEILIAPESIKKIVAIETKLYEINIEVFKDEVLINGIQANIIDARYPRYKDVVPEYSHSITFDRKIIMQAVKEVSVYANKSTNQVNLYMNGQIELSSQDVDFSFEGKKKVPYIEKTFEDTTIGFNGKFFNVCLSNFKEETMEMVTDGQPTKGVIFTNRKERVLLMPLMINN